MKGGFLNVVEEVDAHLEDLVGQCDVEDVQIANVRQLHPILHDLVNTTFFRLFRVNLKRPQCAFWQQPEDEEEEEEEGSKESEATCSGSVPGFFGASSAAPSLTSPSMSSHAETPCSVSSEDEGGVHDEGGLLGSLLGGGANPAGLEDLDEVDHSMTPEEQLASWQRDKDSAECEEDLPTYFVDMCSGDSARGEVEDVNLIKNPERNTGYNGSHIWEAMYNENCFEVGSTLPRGRFNTGDGMCYEERVLYRLLSGWHASTTISIAKHFYPPGTKKKGVWAPNPDKYMEALGRHPDRVKNLHFSFVVLLRSVKKAAPLLRSYGFSTGDAESDIKTKSLVQRLLDSQVLSLCSPLFDAFDETALFQHGPEQRSQLKRQFKSVFRNITDLVDCVECQKCRLHAKVFSQGLGTALKILLTPPVHILATTSRDEMVALVHTLWKLSEAMEDAKELAQMYEKEQWLSSASTAARLYSPGADAPAPGPLPPPISTFTDSPGVAAARSAPTQIKTAPLPSAERTDLLDVALGAVRHAALAGTLSPSDEENVLRSLVVRPATDEVLLLARHYAAAKPTLFATLAQEAASFALGTPATPAVRGQPVPAEPDAIVIGGGLAGMVAALSLLDRGGTVTMVEKQNFLGGNSGKASSGINAALETSVESLVADTTKSAGGLARTDLIKRLAEDSGTAVAWLRDRTGVDLSMRSQLGGHTVKRTLRPSNAFVGAELTFAIGQILNKLAKDRPGQLHLLTKTKWTGMDQASGGAWRVTVMVNGTEKVLEAPVVVVASGGFGHDRSELESLLLKHRPDLATFPTTLGPQTTGDGLKIARGVGAQLVDMDRVQLHPTGFVDPTKPAENTKTLAAELLRGVGGLLLDKRGARFTNELGTRQAVVDSMMKEAAKSGDASRSFALVLNGKAAEMADRHVTLYSKKGLLKKVTGLGGLATHLSVEISGLNRTFAEYNEAALDGRDAFNRTVFPAGHWPVEAGEDFYVGTVCPVIHYTMGGIAINDEGKVLGKDGEPIPGLYAIGEASGGVHGDNRLAGNSLLECTVYGRRVGTSLPIRAQRAEPSPPPAVAQAVPQAPAASGAAAAGAQPLRKISAPELARHNAAGPGYWVALYGKVYDLTDYVEDHPGGPEAITDEAGQDGTEKFEAVHNRELLDSMGFEPVGVLEG